MSAITTLGVDNLSLRGAGTEYNRFSRFFRTRAEAQAAINSGDWTPEAGVANACLTADEGVLTWNADTSVLENADDATREYINAQIANLVGDAPAVLDQLSEIADAIGDDASFITTINEKIDTDVALERARAELAEQTLTTDLETERTRAIGVEDGLSAAIIDIQDGYDFTGKITAPATDNVIPFLYADQTAFPAAADVHGAIAHSHADGAIYFAHAGAWHKLANDVDVIANATDLATETNRAVTAEAALDARLDVLEADPTTATAVAAVQADVDQNEADADAADSALSARLDVLEADPTTETALATERARIDTILSGAGADTDTFAEVVALINSVDTDNDTAFAGYVLSNDAAVAALQADVDQNEADADAAIAALQADVDQNESDADAAIAAVQADVDQNEADADAAIAALQADVDQNESDADAADSALSARLDVLEADPTTATAVAAVQADVDQNEADADAAIAAVQADVDQNEADADAAIAVERGRIDAILAGADADKDTFAEIVTLINSVDTDNDNAFAAYVLSNDAAVAAVQADVDQNEADADAADAALSGRLDALEADPVTQTYVDATTNTEAITRQAQDTTLQANINAVQADVDQNEADADAADAALGVRIDEIEDGFAFQGDISTTNNLTVTGTSDFNGTVTAHDITIDAGGDDAILKFTLETDGGSDKGGLVWNRDSGGVDIGAITYHRSLDTIRFYTNGTSNFDVEIGSGGELNAQNGLAIGGTSVTASADELNFVDGVTSNIQTQLDAIQSDVDQNEADADAAIALKLDASAVSTFGGTLIDDADAAAARTTLGVDAAGTDNSTDVTIAVGLDYISITGQELTLGAVDLASDVTGTLPVANGGTGATDVAGIKSSLDIDHIHTTIGVAANADDLGTFTGTTIDDNVTIKAALQALETAQEATQADVDQNESDADAAIAAVLAGTSIPGPYNNDSDAATGGVAVGSIYKNSNGTIHWRVS